MFATPTFRVFSQENMDNAARKPGSTVKQRKPFRDRTVNSTSSDPDENLKSTTLCKKDIPSTEQDIQGEDLFVYDTCSYGDCKDNFEDLHFKLSEKDAWNILKSYCNYSGLKTPPPEISPNFDMFIEIPNSNFFKTSEEDFKEIELVEESFEAVPLPVIDDLDCSTL